MGNLSTAQKRLIGFIVVLAVVNIVYRLVYLTGYSQTAALYVGVPALLAVGLALLPRNKSAVGALVKGSALATVIACVILPEGVLCLVFAYPLVAFIALVVGGGIDLARMNRRREGPPLMAISLPLVLLSLEGVAGTPFDSRDHATSSIRVEASPDQVAAALASTPDFRAGLPLFLTIGFNRPVAASGSGLAVGDRRSIDFSGGTHDDHPLRLFGVTGERSVHHHSQMHLTVAESSPGRAVFDVDHDGTMLARWADLHRAVVSWRPAGDGTTQVSWRLEYRRLLFPTAYFAPLQRFGMDRAAGYLLESVVVEQL